MLAKADYTISLLIVKLKVELGALNGVGGDGQAQGIEDFVRASSPLGAVLQVHSEYDHPLLARCDLDVTDQGPEIVAPHTALVMPLARQSRCLKQSADTDLNTLQRLGRIYLDEVLGRSHPGLERRSAQIYLSHA